MGFIIVAWCFLFYISWKSNKFNDIETKVIEFFCWKLEVAAAEPKTGFNAFYDACYGASLAMWFMQKYPHLANAAWLSISKSILLSSYKTFPKQSNLLVEKIVRVELI